MVLVQSFYLVKFYLFKFQSIHLVFFGSSHFIVFPCLVSPLFGQMLYQVKDNLGEVVCLAKDNHLSPCILLQIHEKNYLFLVPWEKKMKKKLIQNGLKIVVKSFQVNNPKKELQ